MGRRKCFVHGTVVEICFRTEEGLPFSAAPYITVIFESILARARTFYPARICHCVLMSNHLHLLIVVEDPGIIPSFVEYIKRESAHAVNRLRGRRKHTVWSEDYDSPIILDADKVKERIVYIYTNPARANVVEKIADYPLYNTWAAWLKDGQITYHPRICRDEIPILPKRTISFVEQDKIAEELVADRLPEFALTIEPNAWMDCFDQTRTADRSKINSEIMNRIGAEELRLSKTRTRPVTGAHALRLLSIEQEYQPKKWGRHMLCLSSIKALRVSYIKWFKEHCNGIPPLRRFQSALATWFFQFPPGLFRPGGFLDANLLAAQVPTANTVMLE